MAQLNINRLLDPISRRLRLIISRAKITAVNDGLKAQNVQATVLNGETLDNVERLMEYGLISVPGAGAEAVIGFINAVRDHPVCLVVADRQTRVKGLKTNDSGLYHAEGHTILLTENGEIVVTCKKLRFEVEEDVTTNCKTWAVNASESATLSSPAINLNGPLQMHGQDGESDGDAQLHGNMTITGTSKAADHNSGGVSGLRHGHGGVQRGEDNTDAPNPDAPSKDE